MIQITFTPSTSEQVELVNNVMQAYLAATNGDPAPKKPHKAAVATKTPPAAVATPETVSAPATAVTLEQVRAKLTKLSQGGKTAEVKALLARLGVAKLTDLPVEMFERVMSDAEAI